MLGIQCETHKMTKLSKVYAQMLPPREWVMEMLVGIFAGTFRLNKCHATMLHNIEIRLSRRIALCTGSIELVTQIHAEIIKILWKCTYNSIRLDSARFRSMPKHKLQKYFHLGFLLALSASNELIYFANQRNKANKFMNVSIRLSIFLQTKNAIQNIFQRKFLLLDGNNDSKLEQIILDDKV